LGGRTRHASSQALGKLHLLEMVAEAGTTMYFDTRWHENDGQIYSFKIVPVRRSNVL